MKRISPLRLRKKPGIFALFFLISLLLHLLAGLLLQNRQIFPEPEDKKEETRIALQERKNWLELDQKPLEKAAEPPEEAKHIAEANQKVEKETTRAGEDTRDQQAIVAPTQQAKRQPPPQASPPPVPPQSARQQPPSPPLLPGNNGEHSAVAETEPKQQPIKLPNLTDLTNLSPTTLARLDRQQRQRTKNRPEIELKDDEVWLNLRQDDKLISFFRRFRDRIEAVWNYPIEASSNGIEGILLLKIIVDKKGELIDVFPLKSSGSDLLDYEAIQAIYRAAPFGNLPSYYKHDQLKIYAHFQYSLSRRMIYGQP